jgi:DNA-binding CsgD family transcriptional regulator
MTRRRPANEIEYQDTGGDLYPSCLNCPLPKCRYDHRGSGAKGLERRQRILALSTQGKCSKEIALIVGISKRTVQRVIKEARQKEVRQPQ